MPTVERPEIDDIDRTIIRSVVQDGRLSVRRLAEIVSLSTSATSERLRRLEAAGAILGYTARVAPEVVDRPVDAVVGVRARPVPTGNRSSRGSPIRTRSSRPCISPGHTTTCSDCGVARPRNSTRC